MPKKTSKILYKGHQWAVTTYGIECLDGKYAIKKGSIKTIHAPFPYMNWERAMREKNWVDIGDFLETLQQALKIHFNEDVEIEDLP